LKENSFRRVFVPGRVAVDLLRLHLDGADHPGERRHQGADLVAPALERRRGRRTRHALDGPGHGARDIPDDVHAGRDQHGGEGDQRLQAHHDRAMPDRIEQRQHVREQDEGEHGQRDDGGDGDRQQDLLPHTTPGEGLTGAREPEHGRHYFCCRLMVSM
jgi:hypothetical protein